jgi:hypothetical protein
VLTLQGGDVANRSFRSKGKAKRRRPTFAECQAHSADGIPGSSIESHRSPDEYVIEMAVIIEVKRNYVRMPVRTL